jgi:nucleotide-binding universal stress UspA family protein
VGQSSLNDERFRGCGIQMSIFPTRILLATDGSEEAQLAAKTAAELARSTGSELHVVHAFLWARPTALDPISMDTTVHEAVESRARERLKKIVRRIEASGGAVQGSYLKGGEPDAEIVALGEEIGAGLIVMGSRGLGGMRRALTGTVSDSVVRHAHCPVMVVRGEPVVFPTTILLATDGSENANLAAAAAADLAKSTNSELHVVYVGGMPSVFYESPGAIVLDPDLQSRMEEEAEEAARAKLNEQVQRISEAGGEIAETHVRVGFPDAEIVGLAEELGVGLIAMGSRGLGGLRRALMGSVSDSVVRHAHCPVMVVRWHNEGASEHEADFLT